MTKYLYLYYGGEAPTSPEDGKRVMDEWMAYFGRLGDKIVDGGAPTGPQSSLAGAPESGVTGYSIIEADSLEDAIALTEGHPHLASGGSIEVLETLPMGAAGDMDDEDEDEDEDEEEDVDM